MILIGTDRAAGVGIHAGWALAFHPERGEPQLGDPTLTVTSDRHEGSVEASLPGGLDGGAYTLTVEGLSDADHHTLARGARDGSTAVVCLYLFWYDTTSGVGAYLANVASLTSAVGGTAAEPPADRLVAVLSVVEVARRPGRARYRTVVTARERVFERLGARVPGSMCLDTPLAAVRQAAAAAGVEVVEHGGFVDGRLVGTPSAERARAMTTVTRGSRYRAEIADVAEALVEASGRHGRGVLLVRDGRLHLGVREGQLGGGPAVPLTPATGLVEVVAAGRREGLPGVPGRDAWRVVLKGRPDIKPGAVVAVPRPPADGPPPPLGEAVASAVVGSLGISGPALPSLPDELGENPVVLYVEGVSHALGRTTAFATTVSGVEVSGSDTADAVYDPPPDAPDRAGAAESGGPDPATAVAGAVRRRIREALGEVRHVMAGEVRLVTSAGSGSAEEPPRHTATVWRGLVDRDGHPNRLTRLPVEREAPEIRERVPRLTPFAWGATGLVVPRYPGTRVALAHGDGRPDDPVDIGAVWPAGQGPDSRAGDWWLSLPVGVEDSARSSLPDSGEQPTPHTGAVTHDLIDADGNRVIEVGELTVRVTRRALGTAGTRPPRASEAEPGEPPTTAPGTEDAVTIEHADAGSRIVMAADGTVHISATRIELDATSEIAMTAPRVAVSVTDGMDVRQA